MAGDTVTVVVEISDRGVGWGEATIEIEVQGASCTRTASRRSGYATAERPAFSGKAGQAM
jgi:hypothetical protein